VAAWLAAVRALARVEHELDRGQLVTSRMAQHVGFGCHSPSILRRQAVQVAGWVMATNWCSG